MTDFIGRPEDTVSSGCRYLQYLLTLDVQRDVVAGGAAQAVGRGAGVAAGVLGADSLHVNVSCTANVLGIEAAGGRYLNGEDVVRCKQPRAGGQLHRLALQRYRVILDI